MAHGRSLSWAIPVHAILSVEQTKKAPAHGRPQKAAGARFYAFELRARAQARHPSYGARPFGLVFAVRVGSHPLDF